nr:uncharacterized protein LOC110381637 isoform X1 [Helicoverpa armigera]
MPACSVLTCKSTMDEPSGSSDRLCFHPFPSNEELRAKWVDMTGRYNWHPALDDVVCSKHFRDNDYIIKRSGNRYLKTTAIPCEYVVYKHLYPDEEVLPPAPEDNEVEVPQPETSRAPTPGLLSSVPSSPSPLSPVQMSPGLNLSPFQEADTTFGNDYDMDQNENDIGWEHFASRQYFAPATRRSRIFKRRSSEIDSSSFEERYQREFGPATNPSPPLELNPHMQDLAPPMNPVIDDNVPLEEIKRLLSKHKVCKKAISAAHAEIREARKIKMQLQSGNMSDYEKAEAIIILQKKQIVKLTIKNRRFSKVFKQISSILRKIKARRLKR